MRPLPTFRAPLSVCLLACTIAASACRRDEPIPTLGQLENVELVDQRGRPFSLDRLDGRVWIVDFIFTSCRVYCPLLTEKMRGVRSELADERGAVGFLSLSVDPTTDTPEVLSAYAKRHGIQGDDWVFLTGETAKVSRAVVQGFKTPMGERVSLEDGDGYDILHARHFVLLDRERRIRGYYRTEPEELERLVRDARRLADEVETK